MLLPVVASWQYNIIHGADVITWSHTHTAIIEEFIEQLSGGHMLLLQAALIQAAFVFLSENICT